MLKSIVSYLEIFLILIITGGLLLLALYLSNNLKIKDIKRYYWGNKGFRKYSLKKSNFNIISFLAGYSFFIFVSFNFSAIIYDTNFTTLWAYKGTYINEIPSIMLNAFLGLFAVLGIATAINKKQYITFNVYDILDKYKIKNKVVELLILVVWNYLLYYICAILQNINDVVRIYFALKTLILFGFFIFLFIVFRSSLIIGNILFSNTEFELKVLDNLYTNFWYKDIKIDTEIWDLTGVRYNLDYLLENYYSNKLRKLKKVKFCTIFEENNDLKFTYFISFIFYFGLFFTCLLIILVSEKINIVVSIISIIIFVAMVISAWTFKQVKLFITSRFFDNCGYYYEFNNRIINKRFCTDFSLIDSKCTKNIQYLKCILAFYRIAINKNDCKEIDLLVLKNICNTREVHDDDSYFILLYLILYIKYEKEDNINSWGKEYIEIVEKNLNQSFMRCDSILYENINAVISDINRTNKKGDIKELRNEKFYDFINELKKIDAAKSC